MAKVLQTSPLHRCLGVTPGSSPTWVCAKSSCTAPDLFIFVEIALLVVPYALGASVWWFVAAIVAAGLFAFKLHMPFEAIERLARARVRRNECR